MAGTGGTSSSSIPAELCTFRGLGVGKRDDDKIWLFRELAPPFGVLRWTELALEVDDMDIPKESDLEGNSGEVRAEEGVRLLPRIAGERAAGCILA